MKQRICLPLLLIASIIAFTQSGCKENGLIPAGIAPIDNAVGVYDTSLWCMTHTYFDDTAVTNYSFAATGSVLQGVGAMEDPFFGTMTGATFFQVLPTDLGSVVYDGKVIDSAALILPYSGYSYGDTTDQSDVSYQVFFLNDDVSQGTTYYSYTKKEVDAVNPLSDPFSAGLRHLRDSIEVAGKKYNPGLRIKLRLPTLLSRLKPALAAVDAAGSSEKNNAFLNSFRGVCVRVADTRRLNRAFPYFSLDGSGNYSGAGILVYYHTESGPADTLVQRYYFNASSCGFFNSVTRSYSHYPVNELIRSASADDSVIAIQNAPGVNLDIVIPGLRSLPSGVINKAEVRLAILPWRKDARFDPVDRLFPVRINNGIYPSGSVPGSIGAVLDQYSSSNPITALAFMDGRLHNIDNNGTTVETYTINIPREVMASREAGNDTLHLHLTGTQVFTGAYRSILGGGNRPGSIYRAKLFVVYSALNKQ